MAEDASGGCSNERPRGGRSDDPDRDRLPGQPGHGRPGHGPPWARGGPDWHRAWRPPDRADRRSWREHGPPAHVRRRFLRAFLGGALVVLVVATGTIVGVVAAASRLLGDGPTVPAVAGAIGLLVVIAIVLVGGGLVLARRFAAPLADVVEGAERVRAGEVDVRVDPRGPHDVRRLATTFNDMATRLDSGDDGRCWLTSPTNFARRCRLPKPARCGWNAKTWPSRT